MIANPSTQNEIVNQIRQKASYKEYLALETESQIIEWINGEMIFHIHPTNQHQKILGLIVFLLGGFNTIKSWGTMLFAPFEVKLWPDGPSREPDILFVKTANQAQLQEKRFEGAPDLVVEIVSPSSAKIDRVDKFLEYEKAGVSEYWLIDPRSYQRQADFYVLDETGSYFPAPIDDNGRFHSTVLPNFYLNLNWLQATPLPNPQQLLAEIVMQAENVPEDIRLAFKAVHAALSQIK